jgi:protein SCO1/2
VSPRGSGDIAAAAVAVAVGVGVALLGATPHARADARPTSPYRHPARTRPPSPGPLDAADASAIARRWGIAIESLRTTASGYMLDLRYRVVDAGKAKPLFVRKTKPRLRDEATGLEMAVPVPPKTGALRNSNEPRAGRTYFMFFANPNKRVGPGGRVTLTIGDFAVQGIRVEREAVAQATAAPAPSAEEGHEAHRASAAAASRLRVMDPQPDLGEIPFVDQAGRSTSLRAALDTDEPVLLNFIFTSCTTVCPIMTAGFAQLRDRLGAERDGVRLVSISIDPDVDTVERLRAYAARHGAGGSWRFLTGSAAATRAAQIAFGAYRGDKGNHAPATYLRRARGASWEALDGLQSAQALLQAYRGDGATRGF